jgi:short-subunit dehydrogenase
VCNIDRSGQLINIVKNENLPIEVLSLDVTNETSVRDTVGRMIKESTKIDVLVNNAGYGLIGSLEDITMEEIKSHFETNLFGAVRVMQAVLPIMREQRSGTIVNISSMGDRIAFPLSSTYSGTKFALEGITESLSYEVQQFGIRVMLIEPGVVRTNFANNIKKAGKTMKPDSPHSRLLVAKVILEAINSDSPDLRYVVGHDALRLLDSRMNMSDSEFKRFMMGNFFGISEIPK